MKIIFLGVGEAFDENLPNNSQLVMSGKTNLLLDCGFTVPQQADENDLRYSLEVKVAKPSILNGDLNKIT